MKNYRQFIKFFGLLFLCSIVFCIVLKCDNIKYIIGYSLISLFVLESTYYILERKSRNIRIYNIGKIKQHKRNALMLVIIGFLAIAIEYYNGDITFKSTASSLIFFTIGLRGLIFSRQTVKSIRIFEKGIEIGFFQQYYDINKIRTYSIKDNCIVIQIKNKNRRINLKKTDDIIEIANIL